MTILVTGGAGYIGSHTCVELISAGFDVVVVDDFSNSKRESLRRAYELLEVEFSYYPISILDTAAMDRVFTENNIEAVIHFAGFKAVGESVAQPLKYYENNVGGTIKLCELMAKHGVDKLIFSSSATVYGDPHTVPIKEDFPTGATNPYGRSKLMVEEILQDLSRAPDNPWKISVLRYFNPIGAHESGRMGEDPQGIPNNLLPYISQVAVGKLEKLQVFGNDYPTADGTGVRDYIHVVDLARGHVKALEFLMKKSPGVFIHNLGTGRGYSVLEIIKAFEEASGVNIPYDIVARRPGDIAECYADPEKAKSDLGWEAEFGIQRMVEDTWRWQSKNPKGYVEKRLLEKQA